MEVDSPLTTAFWINLVLVVISIIVVVRLSLKTRGEEPEVFDPYRVLGITIGANDKTIKSAYRRMAKL